MSHGADWASCWVSSKCWHPLLHPGSTVLGGSGGGGGRKLLPVQSSLSKLYSVSICAPGCFHHYWVSSFDAHLSESDVYTTTVCHCSAEDIHFFMSHLLMCSAQNLGTVADANGPLQLWLPPQWIQPAGVIAKFWVSAANRGADYVIFSNV
jgi:hypothetical protein